MTVQYEIPYVSYDGNDVTTDFAFTWSSGDISEIYARKNGVDLERDVDFSITGYSEENGGVVHFSAALITGDVLEIWRSTPITQEVDFTAEPFPIRDGEFQYDKDTRILQELVHNGIALGGSVDLDAVPGPNYVDITNTSGRDARIPAWQTSPAVEEAGVFFGEVRESALPTDGSVTDKPDGYVWFSLAGSGPSTPTETPHSTTYAADGGWAATNDNYTSAPYKAHPFESVDETEWFMSMCGKCTTAPSDGQIFHAFDMYNSGLGTGLMVGKAPAGSRYFESSLFGYSAGHKQISQKAIYLDTDLIPANANWSGVLTRWWWFGCSYSKTLNEYTNALVDFTNGLYFTNKISGVTNNINVNWDDPLSGKAQSVAMWGVFNLGSSDYWHGYQSQVIMAGKYFDLTSLLNIKKFVADGLDGIRPEGLGVGAVTALGETAFVYLPYGHPSYNEGTLDLTTYPDDYYLVGTDLFQDQDTPPVGAA